MNNQIVIGGNLISFSKTGEGKQTVLFLHGWRSQKEVWAQVISKLKIIDGSFCTLDLPGFGSSSLPKNPWTVNDYAKLVADFIFQQQLQDVILVGHSFGGRVGIKLASHFPEIISKLVLIDSAGFVSRSRKQLVYNILAAIVSPVFRPRFMQGLRAKIYKIIGASDYVASKELRETFLNVINEDLSEDMKKIICPTLILTGENDTDTPVEFGERIQALIPNSRFIILPGSGHFSFIDKPEEVVKELQKFIF